MRQEFPSRFTTRKTGKPLSTPHSYLLTPHLLYGFLVKPLLIRLLQLIEQRGIPAAERPAVQLACADAVRAGGQDHHLIRVLQLVHGERRDAGRHAEPVAQREKMPARNARQDEIIRRRRAEHAVLEDRQTGMRTLGHTVAAMENDLVRVEVSDGVFENIITTLSEEDFTPDDIKYCYNLRWPIMRISA